MSLLRNMTALAAAAMLVASTGCVRTVHRETRATRAAAHDECKEKTPKPHQPIAVEIERDQIFSLLAYAIVAKSWQPWDENERRGYNIGAILVDEKQNILCWAVNSIEASDNGTQHAEARLMTNFLEVTKDTKLAGTMIYTTLEPCAMCAGMMTLQKVKRAVYGQTDPLFGKAIERLTLDLHGHGGYCPYPRGVQSIPATDEARATLDEKFEASDSDNIVQWLASGDAESIYTAARERLLHFRVRHAENADVLRAAQTYYYKVPKHYVAAPYHDACAKPDA